MTWSYYTRTDLKCLIISCKDFLIKNKLQLNYDLSKIVIFGKFRKPFSWSFKGNKIEQVMEFKYLGIYCHFKYS